MPWSCEALLGLARRVVRRRELVDPSTWPPESVFSGSWRFRVASVGVVECTLGGTALGGPDVAFCVEAAGGREPLAREAARGEHEGGTHSGVGVWRFITRWHDPGSPLHAHVPLVWVEFDRGQLSGRRAIPFLTFMLSDAIAAEANGAGRSRFRELVAEGLEALTGPLAARRLQAVLDCIARLPEGGQPRHFAAMPHRGTDDVRVIVSMRRADVPSYLGRLGWAGSTSGLAATLAALDSEDHLVSVNLDVGERVRSRVGMELYWPTSPLDDERWTRVLDALGAMGCCTPAERTALSRWPTREAGAAPARLGALVRRLLVKVVFADSGLTGAKAYLALKPTLSLFETPAHTLESSAPGS